MKHPEKNKRAFLICFTGIDGSGKTTLATTLADTMEANGIKSKYIWCGWRQFDSLLLGPFAAIVRRLLRRETGAVDRLISRKVAQNRFLSLIYGYLVLLDYFLSTFPKVRIPLIFGRTVVCDRYVYDVMTDSILHHNNTGKIILNLFPKPDLTFLIDLPEEVAYQRKVDVPSVDYLRKKRQLYLDVVPKRISKDRLLVVDGSEDVGEIGELIWHKAAETLGATKKISGVSTESK